MHTDGFLFQAFVFLAAAVITVPLAKRLGLGSVLGYLIAGIIIGPFGLGLIATGGGDIMHFAEIGVVMMLFVIGLELEPALLWRMRNSLLGFGGAQLLTTTAAIAGIALVAGVEWRAALAIGMILSLSSTAIVLQSLAEKGLMKTDAGQRSFAVLLFQDIAVIPMLALLPLLAVAIVGGGTVESGSAESHSWVETLSGWMQTLVVLGAVGGTIVIGNFLVRPALNLIAETRLREMFTAAALLLVVGITLLMTFVGLSPALGAFLAGVVLAGSEYRHELESDIEPFKGLLLGLFFLAVGASIDFALIAASAGLVTILVVVLIAVKFAVLFGVGRGARMGLDQNLLFAVALAQGGEFCFVLLSFATQNGVLEAGTSGLLVAVVALSMAATPVLLVLNERVLQPRFGTRGSDGEREADVVDDHAPVIICGFGRFGSVVGRLLSANGVQSTVLDIDSDNVDLLRKFGLKVYYGDATREQMLHAAGAERARLIVLALDDPDRTTDLAAMIRKHYPDVPILARTHGRSDAYDLLDMGIDDVYMETFDSALRLGVDALRHLGFHAYIATRAAQQFRKLDQAALRELGAMRGDRTEYISRTRERIADLERTMRLELDGNEVAQDGAWDATTLREEYGGGGRG